MTAATPVLQTSFSDLQLARRGKVRDVYSVDDDHLLIVATDRISAFDCVLPTPIARKGEVLTALSRFWPADQYEPGKSQPSFDKQFVRDYLETLDWNKQPPAPPLPPEIAQATSERYLEAYRLLAGKSLESGV